MTVDEAAEAIEAALGLPAETVVTDGDRWVCLTPGQVEALLTRQT